MTFNPKPGIYVCLLLKSVPLRDTIGKPAVLLKDLVIMGEAWNTLCSNENPEDKARADTIGFRLVASTYKTVKKVEYMSTAVN